MVKRIISVVLAIAVIAGFSVVCSAAAYTTGNITGSYKSLTEKCSYEADMNADVVVLSAEGFRNSKSLGDKTKSWKGDSAVYNHSVSYFNIVSNKGYHVGYYKVGNTMYYNRGYDYES